MTKGRTVPAMRTGITLLAFLAQLAALLGAKGAATRIRGGNRILRAVRLLLGSER